ncbi:glycosyltransferase family 4 protein [Flavobacterium sp.]|uniref:glycosyltransferase family 4 protein n=1 Tax=Flavobacterium sp. TaxID=239 RepID=UPI00286BDDB7|nr:glycosyltransferase family 4 protein [Flavobacterium sp.]
MHIAFLTPEYPHPKVKTTAGIGTTILNLATELIKHQHQVSVFVYGQATDEIFYENDIKIHLIASKKFDIATWFYYRKYLEKYINQYVDSDKIDLIEAPDWTGITAFMNLKVPLIIRFHGSDAYFCHLENRRQKIKNFLLEKWGIQKATAYISPSDFASKITQYIFRIKHKPIIKIPSGLSLEKFHNPTPNDYQKGLILYMGTIIRKKGVLELAPIFEKVVREYPEAQLIIVGSDSYDIKTKLASTWLLLQNALNGATIAKVKYLGKVPYHDIQQYIRSANVCVFPTFAETQGMVTIEAMAMQKAVVNSNIGWANEIIEDGKSGFLVHPKEHDLFANRILQVIRNESLNATMGKAAREKVAADFDINQLVIKNIDFYLSVIQEKK